MERPVVTEWEADDIQALRRLESGIGPIKILEINQHSEEATWETALTDQQAENGVDWTGVSGAEAPTGMAETTPVATTSSSYTAPVAYPEYNDNPHNHRLTISMDSRGPHICVRGNTATEINAGLNELDAYGVMTSLTPIWQAIRAMVSPPPVASAPPPPAAVQPPPGYGQGAMPAQYPPQLGPSVPGTAPAGWQNTGAPAPSAAVDASRAPKPCPPGWLKCDCPWARKDELKALRTANAEFFRGKMAWGGGGTWWVEPSLGQWLAQQGYPVGAAQ